MADLTGVWAKFHHAQTHIEAFDRGFTDFLRRDPYSVALEFDPDTGGYHALWRVIEQPPLKLSLINGDIWSNLRASLDHLVWQLVLANNETPTRRSAFPCVERSEDWTWARSHRLGGVAKCWVDEIETLQPHHGGNRPDLHPLALLDAFNNINKHRFMPPVVTAPAEIVYTVSGGLDFELTGETFPERPIEQGTEFVSISCKPPGPISDLEMTVHPGTVFHISFPDESNHAWEMTTVVEWVERAIAIFEPAFPR